MFKLCCSHINVPVNVLNYIWEENAKQLKNPSLYISRTIIMYHTITNEKIVRYLNRVCTVKTSVKEWMPERLRSLISLFQSMFYEQ